MTSRRRTIGFVAGALAVTVTAATFLPQDHGRQDGITQSSAGEQLAPGQQAVAGKSAVTTEAQAEIDRVVAEGLAAPRISARTKASAYAATQVRCAEFEGQRYCLGQGWTTDSAEQVQARVATELNRVAARPRVSESTGDLDPLTEMRQLARMKPSQRAAREREELTQAAQSVAKVWLLRHEIEGTPLPDGFLQQHPEVRVTDDVSARSSVNGKATRRTWAQYPASAAILDPREVQYQYRSYWCGPATMQMIAWGWRGTPRSQNLWAGRLGTTSSGTAITEIVRVVNERTGWDNPNRAGRYITLDIGRYSFGQWYQLVMRHISRYKAPIVMHPILLKRYYSYIDDDASGHFQVGRGYRTRPGKPNLVGIFEPWNQQRFDPSEPFIKRVQWYSAYRQYRANKAHFQHNIGV